MICKYCGKEINDGAVFCEFCGGVQDKTEETKAEETNTNVMPAPEQQPKKSNNMTKVIIALAVIAVVLVGVVIGVSKMGKTAEGNKTAQQSAAEQADYVPTEEDAIKAVEKIFDKVKDDEDFDITTLVINDNEDSINFYKQIPEFIRNNKKYNQRHTIINAKYENNFGFATIYYITDSENNKKDAQTFTGAICYNKGEWKFQADADTLKKVEEQLNKSIEDNLKDYSEELYNAYKNKKHRWLFSYDNNSERTVKNYNYLFLNGECMYEGIIQQSIIGAFDTGECVDFLVELNNGSDSNYTWNNLTLELYADNDTMYSNEVNADKFGKKWLDWKKSIIVPAKGSELTIISVRKDQLKQEYRDFVTNPDAKFFYTINRNQ